MITHHFPSIEMPNPWRSNELWPIPLTVLGAQPLRSVKEYVTSSKMKSLRNAPEHNVLSTKYQQHSFRKKSLLSVKEYKVTQVWLKSY